MKTKIYDKELYKKEKSFNDAMIVIIAFLLGFALGIYSMNLEVQNRDERIRQLESEIVEMEKLYDN